MQYYREVRRIVKWEGGAVVWTEHVGFEWVDHQDYQRGNLMFTSVSPDLIPGGVGVRRTRSEERRPRGKTQ